MRSSMLALRPEMPSSQGIDCGRQQQTLFSAGNYLWCYYGRTAPILAGLLGCEMVTFPGHHLSYLDMPGEWAAVLRAVLQRGENRGHPTFPAFAQQLFGWVQRLDSTTGTILRMRCPLGEEPYARIPGRTDDGAST